MWMISTFRRLSLLSPRYPECPVVVSVPSRLAFSSLILLLYLSLAIWHMKSKSLAARHHRWRRKQKLQPKSNQRSSNSHIASLRPRTITLSFWIPWLSSIQPSKSRTRLPTSEHLAARFTSHLQSISLWSSHIHVLTRLHRASDACDIENFAEYSEIIKLIKEKKPKSVTVTINQKDVERALKKVFSTLFYCIQLLISCISALQLNDRMKMTKMKISPVMKTYVVLLNLI